MSEDISRSRILTKDLHPDYFKSKTELIGADQVCRIIPRPSHQFAADGINPNSVAATPKDGEIFLNSNGSVISNTWYWNSDLGQWIS